MVGQHYLYNLGICMLINALFICLLKTNRQIVRYSSFKDALRIFTAILSANVVLLILSLIARYYDSASMIFPGVGFLLNFSLSFSFIFAFRMSVKLIFEHARKKSNSKEVIPILINGTSNLLVNFATVLTRSSNYKIIGFVTQDADNADKKILGLPVYTQESIRKELTPQGKYKAILINPRELGRSEKQFLFDFCLQHDVELLSTPDLHEWKDKGETISSVARIKIEDLLGRIPIAIDVESIGRNLEGKTVLVTGAAGSIGSEIVRQLSRFQVGMLILCDNSETPLHELCLELTNTFPDIKYKAKICNVQDHRQMKHVMEKYKPNYVYHAAAYKHVPLMENHPCEAILTNVLGTKNVIDLAVANGAEAFVMVSTDKAVNPSNVMGASKRIAEIYVQSLSRRLKESAESNIRIITTRFGNVLGSNGSVIPVFKKQIEKGGPITVTHPEIIRYFMTIPEACRLVLEAGNFGKGGEVFLFDMGEPVKIKDLAERMIKLSGLEPYRDIDIAYTGLRPGEKLYEELLHDKEKVKPTHNKKIMIGQVREYDIASIQSEIEKLLETAVSYDKNTVVARMKTIVPEFISQNSIYSELDQQLQN